MFSMTWVAASMSLVSMLVVIVVEAWLLLSVLVLSVSQEPIL